MIPKLLAPHTERAYAVLRIVAGVMFAFHGMQKVFGVLNPHPIAFGSQLWVGGVIELTGGLAIALGCYTAWAAFICSGTMAVAYTQFHWKFRFDSNFFPAVNQGGYALLNSFLFLFIACKGAGPWSFDASRAAKSHA